VSDEPELPEYPGRSLAFRRIMRTWGVAGEGKERVHDTESQVRDVMEVTDEELVILARLHIRDIGTEAEVARRSIAALLDFKQNSAKAAKRLQRLTWGLIAFTAALGCLTAGLVVLTFGLLALTMVLVVHDLTR
jgi:hypothetical protein